MNVLKFSFQDQEDLPNDVDDAPERGDVPLMLFDFSWIFVLFSLTPDAFANARVASVWKAPGFQIRCPESPRKKSFKCVVIRQDDHAFENVRVGRLYNILYVPFARSFEVPSA